MAALLLASAAQMPVMAADKSTSYEVTESFSASVSTRSAGTVLDFTSSGATTVRSVSISELIGKATGDTVSAAEEAYLSSLGITMKYDESLSSTLISTSARDTDLTFQASVKSYQANNGSTIRWVPVSVTMDGKTQELLSSPQGYTATFTGLTKDTVYTATFQYQTTISVSTYALATFINRAYDDAMTAIAAQKAYEDAKLEYSNAQTAYQAALKEYETLYATYQKYQQELKAYNTELSAYNAYMKKVKAYEEAMAVYTKYLEELASYDERYATYEKELEELPKKQEEYEKYLDYLALLRNAEKQLVAINSAFIPDSVGRTMYATLMGDTVAQVLAQKDVLVNMAGASEADINNAGASTTVLQDLLTAYSRQSGTEAQLRWYTDNYGSLKGNFIQLYSSLFSLGNNVAVRRYLKQEGKWERYAQFVGQLYIISTGLDDTITFDSNWTFDAFDILSLIEPMQRIEDSNSCAPTAELPEKMEPVAKPTPPVAPKKPTEVAEPIKTWTEDVAHPGDAPAVVAEPKKPSLDDFTSGVPQVPQISTQLQAVVDLVNAGKLTQRSGASSNVDMTFTASFSTSASISSAPVVTFYDHDGKTVLFSTQVQKGSTAYYGGIDPTREADAQYSYVFSGWTDAQGKDANLSNIQANTAFYAKYSEKLNRYTITWNVAGERITETYDYGQMPYYEAKRVYRDDTYAYTFSGWSPSVSKVTGDATYTAQYTERKLDQLTFAIMFEVRGEVYYRMYTYGEMPNFTDFETDYVSGGYRYVFTGWSPELTEVTDDIKYVANFEKMFLIPAGENGESSAEMVVTKTSHTVITDEYIVNAAYAVEEALKAGTQLVLQLGGATVTLDAATLKQIPEAAIFRLAPSGARSGMGAEWIFEITDEKGNAITPASEILVELPISEEAANGGKLRAYINGKATGVSIQEDVAYLRLKETGEIALRPYYTVTVLTEGSGQIVPASDNAEVGSSVKLQSYLEQGWIIETLTISVDGGEETALVLTDGAFTMPSGDVTIRAVLKEAEYTVIFVVNGEEVSKKTYHYGDTVETPDMQGSLSYERDGKTYTFAGWDSTVSPVTSDITYTAKYEVGRVGGSASTWISDHDSNRLITVGLPIFLSVLTLGIAALVIFLIIKKRNGGVVTWSIIKKEFAAAWRATKTAFGKAWRFVKTKSAALWRAAGPKLKSAWAATKSGCKKAWTATKTAFGKAGRFIKTKAAALGRAVGPKLKSAWTATKSGCKKAWTATKSAFGKAGRFVKAKIDSVRKKDGPKPPKDKK